MNDYVSFKYVASILLKKRKDGCVSDYLHSFRMMHCFNGVDCALLRGKSDKGTTWGPETHIHKPLYK